MRYVRDCVNLEAKWDHILHTTQSSKDVLDTKEAEDSV